MKSEIAFFIIRLSTLLAESNSLALLLLMMELVVSIIHHCLDMRHVRDALVAYGADIASVEG